MKRLAVLVAGTSLRGMRDDRGVTAIEMACVLFFLTVLILGTFELPRMLLLAQKLERASASMADLVAQIDPADGNVQNKIDDLMLAASGLLSPYDLGTNGRVIISSVGNPSGSQETILWQQTTGTIAAVSKVGVAGSAPTMPGGLIVREGENIIVAEVAYHYEPLFGSLIYDEKTLYSSAFTRPRFSNLTAAPN
ncbi:Flp pilus assembly protein TadG [Dongia mobilis]|uniref:Flp pilus assembly protein TadG n=1 Tax=Dongia mobilis TaxID=578943 RepID=A0A4R6WQV9_9PROT|nr:TadE/TadG family type IV pilus assembly protein [Dongia mobilis]TDQ78942.1 Flp pilus assembly protein TadG [Dongia mobilis]